MAQDPSIGDVMRVLCAVLRIVATLCDAIAYALSFCAGSLSSAADLYQNRGRDDDYEVLPGEHDHGPLDALASPRGPQTPEPVGGGVFVDALSPEQDEAPGPAAIPLPNHDGAWNLDSAANGPMPGLGEAAVYALPTGFGMPMRRRVLARGYEVAPTSNVRCLAMKRDEDAQCKRMALVASRFCGFHRNWASRGGLIFGDE